MTEQNTNQELPPIIPSWVFGALIGLGLLVGLVAFILQGQIDVVSIGSWAIALIALFAWALMFPQQLLDIIKGRGFAFGGTATLIVIALVIAAGFIYVVVREQTWRKDFSERDVYSLDVQVRDVLESMGQDPRIPAVTFVGLYGPSSADTRDRFEVLFNDMESVANGKISHRFIDPNREVRFLEQYTDSNDPSSSLRSGQVIVATIDPETGQASTENFEVISAGSTAQFDLINAMLKLSTVGDFRAYFLGIDGGIDITRSGNNGANQYADNLGKNNWTVEQVSPLQISGDAPQVILNDVAADAEVIVMGGGTQALDDVTMATVENYAANGGDLIILGSINTSGGVTTAQAENMSNFLWNNYGVRLRDDLALDPDNSVGNPETIIVKTYGTHQIVQGLNSDSDWIVMESPHSIEIADPVPVAVTVTVLVSTTDSGYTKTGLDFSQDFSADDLAFTEGDATGQIVVGVAVENANTGSRLVLFGSDALLKNNYRQYREVVSPEVITSAIVWASDAQNFADDLLRIIPEPPAQDDPIIITDSDMRWASFWSLFLLPFGTLGVGFLVWWLQRGMRSAQS
jgi:hypothetical protein